MDQLRAGDAVVVWKLDRLARSTRDLLDTMEKIREIGAKFQSLSEPWADTTTHAGKMIMTVFAGNHGRLNQRRRDDFQIKVNWV
jgi:DNA invertase Pin-like site-specific DNA recombinase